MIGREEERGREGDREDDREGGRERERILCDMKMSIPILIARGDL